MEFCLYFYKDENRENRPFMYSEGTIEYSDLFDKELIRKIHKDFPQTVDNLYVFINGTEFKIA